MKYLMFEYSVLVADRRYFFLSRMLIYGVGFENGENGVEKSRLCLFMQLDLCQKWEKPEPNNQARETRCVFENGNPAQQFQYIVVRKKKKLFNISEYTTITESGKPGKRIRHTLPFPDVAFKSRFHANGTRISITRRVT